MDTTRDSLEEFLEDPRTPGDRRRVGESRRVLRALAGALPAAAAAGSLALLAALLLYLCGQPLSTADTWWHLKMGEVYTNQGLSLSGDPLLHTLQEHPPVPHSWLFGVAIHAIDQRLGLHGLRVAHVLAVGAILALVFSMLLRESATRLDACFGTCVFIVLSWYRLFQLRPDLVSILSSLLLYRLLLERGGPPQWRRVAASVVLMLVWANAHSVFAVGLMLLAVALVGLAARAGLRRWKMSHVVDAEAISNRDATTAKRVGAALILGSLVTLLNPRGIYQHLTYFASSQRAVIWGVLDDWTPFDLFAPGKYGDAAGFSVWLTADFVIGCFVLLAVLAFARFVMRPSVGSLERSDPALVAVAVASAFAALISIRFLWMLVFPLLFVLRFRRLTFARGFASRGLSGVLALGSVVLALAFPQDAGFRRQLLGVPSSFSDYVSTPYDEERSFAEAVRFLKETELAGNLFNTYPMGGVLGYWLAPRLRTFIDGRSEVFEDYSAIIQMRGFREGEDFLDVLDRRKVDVFLGTGVPPTAAGRRYCAAHLERAPGWTLVSRSMRHAVYLRSNERNRENLDRIVAYYEREGVPFDAETGLQVASVIRARPDWAEARGILPVGYSEVLAARESSDPDIRFRALEVLGETLVLVGAYADQIEFDREAIALQPMARVARYRLVFGLLRLDRPTEALKVARALRALAPKSGRSLRFWQVAREYARRRSLAEGIDAKPAEAIEAPINTLPLILHARCASCRRADWVRRFFDSPLEPGTL